MLVSAKMKLSFVLTKLVFFQAFFYLSCLAERDRQIVSNTGDIVIAGLFPIHNSKKDGDASDICDLESFKPNILLYSQVMIYAIEQINNLSSSNFKIGYEMYDTCSDVFVAMNATLRILEKQALLGEEYCNHTGSLGKSNVKAVIGEYTSEMSVAVARLLSLARMTQISYGSTSESLSGVSKFPSFFRTVPNDKQQAKAIANLVKEFNFVPVAIFGSDDEYGRYGAESLNDYFRQYNICIEFKEILPNDLSNQSSKLAYLQYLLNTSKAEAIVLFTHEQTAKTVLKETVRLRKNRTWIASDGWSTSGIISQMQNLSQVGRILGVTCKINNVSGFVEYMEEFINRQNTTENFLSNILTKSPFCNEQQEKEQSCTSFASKPVNSTNKCISKTCLLSFIRNYRSYEPYTVYLAVQIIDQAIKSALQTNDKDFPAWKLIEVIENVSIDNSNTNMKMSENRDIELGYDILELTTSGPQFIGTYDKNVINISANIPQESLTQFNCSKSCNSGFELKGNSCCKICEPCMPGTFSNGNGSTCEPCNDSSDSKCKEMFLPWEDGFSITLALFAAVGLVITIAVFALFWKYYCTPVVKAAGGYLCFLALFSLLGCFTSVYLLLDEPTDLLCMSAMPLFGLSYTLCVSCILSNLLQIFICFAYDIKYGNLLKRINKYPVLVIVCTSVQVIVCTLWLVLYPPHKYKLTLDTIILVCKIGSPAFYCAMLVYIALLCIIGFLFAYKGRRLPDLYKNASFIKISMLVYLVVWVIFIPVYILNSSEQKRAYEALAILVSSYGILFCHFGPKCKIMILNNELNDENKIVQHIRNYYESKGITITGKNYSEFQN